MPATDVLVVSYRRADLLERCLASVARELPGAPVHVWDNASVGSPAVRALAERWSPMPAVQWTFCPANIGFARAVNALAARTGSPSFLLLNPDAELVGPLIGTRAALEGGDRTAAAAPMSVDEHGVPSWDNAHRTPTLVRQLVSHAGHAGRLRHGAVSDLYPEPPRGPVGYLTGSCLLVSRRAWEQVGGFDERYFLYSEEVDWATRAASAGWALRLVPEVGFRHRAGGTVAGDPAASRRSAELLRANQVRYLADHRGPATARAYAAGAGALDRLQRSKRRAAAHDEEGT